MRGIARGSLVLLLVVVAWNSAVSAQEFPQVLPDDRRDLSARPYQRLTLDTTVFGGGGQDLRGDDRDWYGPASGLSSNLAFAVQRARRNIDVGLATALMHQPTRAPGSFWDHVNRAYMGGVRMASRVGRRSNLTLMQSVSFAPATMAGLFPTTVTDFRGIEFLDRATSVDNRLGADASGTFDHPLGRQAATRLLIEAGARGSRYSSDLSSARWTGGGGVTHQLREGFGLLFRYTATHSSTWGPRASNGTRLHQLNAGANVSTSLTRGLSVGASSGSAILEHAGQTSVRGTGEGRIRQELGGTWSIQAAGGHSVGYLDGVDVPLAATALAVNLRGSFARALQLSMHVTGSRGRSADGSAGRYRAFTASAGAQYVFASALVGHVEYIRFLHEFEGILLPASVLSGSKRHSVRGGIQFRFPLWTNF
jgi:hypothetical protein